MKKMVILLMVFFFVLSFDGFVFAKDEPAGDLSTWEVVADLLCGWAVKAEKELATLS